MLSVLALLPLVVASRKPVVLTYHDMVMRRDSKALWFDCTPTELESQLDWLSAQGASFVSTRELYLHLSDRKPLPKNPVVITFADNYLGFYKLAWPILKKRRIPVTMFIHTGFVGSSQGRPKMSWAHLQSLARDPLFTGASQTVSHPLDLTKMTDEQVMREFRMSRATLKKHLPGFGADFLAYPNGKYDARVSGFAAKAGYVMAFTEAMKPASSAPDLWRVPRYVHTKYRQAWTDAR